MRSKLIGLVVGLCSLIAIQGFSQSPSRLNYNIKFSMQGYNLPLKQLMDNFKNPGIALGIAYGYDVGHSTSQSLNIGWLNHAEHGNAIYLSTQFHYRPSIGKIKPGIGLGVGRIIYFNNSNPLYDMVGARWEKSRSQSEGRWIAPLTADVGYQLDLGKYYQVTPFIGYEIIPTIKYNNAFPVLPSSLLTVGSRFNLFKK